MTQPQAYAVTEGDGLPVVFVHGMGVDHRSLMLLDEALLCPESGAAASRSLKRIYLDLPGFGRTPALPARACGLPEMADWLQSAIDDLVGAGSRSRWSAIRWAVHSPVRWWLASHRGFAGWH